ncbi:aldo/keto reductase [Actinoplanes sp. LDG1-06]|uniref:Aldo/keto reductase n=1 Tax=Paractinoplanes ovalisporus TaxID=2810368 RepID=A0ABS2ANG7_9ACTN|nr:aldo/keto reductase [Actinoplanes ovalisporus]MBM2621407.1 aldo/keto reductase [Actinoplanes ovalisporus]
MPHLSVGRVGFGAMQLPTTPESWESSIAVLRRAVELGVPLIDTAYLYGGGANEELVAGALHPYGESLVVTTKVGVSGSGPLSGWRLDGRPESLRRQVDGCLRRLRVDRITLLQLHRIDPEVPLADQVGTLREVVAAGKAELVGLSEVTVCELASARAVTEIASVQNRYNLVDRTHEPVLQACTESGIAFLPWRPLAYTSEAHTTPTESAHSSATAVGTPATGEHAGSVVEAIAAELGATAQQVALAWLLGRSPVMLPIPGTASLDHLEQNVAAEALRLSAMQRARLDDLAH